MAIKNFEDLGAMEIDVLTEVGNIGAGNIGIPNIRLDSIGANSPTAIAPSGPANIAHRYTGRCIGDI